jgi:hypothetical protein
VYGAAGTEEVQGSVRPARLSGGDGPVRAQTSERGWGGHSLSQGAVVDLQKNCEKLKMLDVRWRVDTAQAARV